LTENNEAVIRSCECFGFALSVSFHQCSIFIHLSITDALQSEQLTVSLNNTLKID
jgi:hypothetical protein